LPLSVIVTTVKLAARAIVQLQKTFFHRKTVNTVVNNPLIADGTNVNRQVYK